MSELVGQEDTIKTILTGGRGDLPRGGETKLESCVT